MNPRVKEVVAKDNYTLLIYFTNGEKGIYDVKPLMNLPVFRKLQTVSVFNSATVGNGKTVCWGDDIDISPDTLYLDSVKI